MQIGELARATGLSIQAIRFYERERLVPEAPRSEGNYRIYGTPHAERLGFIRRCRSLDMALNEIRTLLGFKDSPRENCAKVNPLHDDHIGHVSTLTRPSSSTTSRAARCASAGRNPVHQITVSKAASLSSRHRTPFG